MNLAEVEQGLLGTIILVIAAAAILIFFETVKSIPEEGKWGQPKYVALEVVIVGVLIWAAMAVWSWVT